MVGDLFSTAHLHPFVDPLGIVHDLGDRAVKTEETIGQVERIAGLSERPHAAHQIRSAAADHDIERRWAVAAEMFAQGIAHGAKGLVYVSVVRLAADDE